jgi:hypothetical protein
MPEQCADTPAQRVVDTLAQIPCGGYPYRHVELPATRRLMRCRQILTGEKAAELLDLAARLTRVQLAGQINDAVMSVYVIDGWTRPHAGDRTIGHFFLWLSREYEWHEALVSLERFANLRETAETIAASMDRVTRRMGADKSLVQLVGDGASVNVKAFRLVNLMRKAR